MKTTIQRKTRNFRIQAQDKQSLPQTGVNEKRIFGAFSSVVSLDYALEEERTTDCADNMDRYGNGRIISSHP